MTTVIKMLVLVVMSMMTMVMVVVAVTRTMLVLVETYVRTYVDAFDNVDRCVRREWL